MLMGFWSSLFRRSDSKIISDYLDTRATHAQEDARRNEEYAKAVELFKERDLVSKGALNKLTNFKEQFEMIERKYNLVSPEPFVQNVNKILEKFKTEPMNNPFIDTYIERLRRVKGEVARYIIDVEIIAKGSLADIEKMRNAVKDLEEGPAKLIGNIALGKSPKDLENALRSKEKELEEIEAYFERIIGLIKGYQSIINDLNRYVQKNVLPEARRNLEDFEQLSKTGYGGNEFKRNPSANLAIIQARRRMREIPRVRNF